MLRSKAGSVSGQRGAPLAVTIPTVVLSPPRVWIGFRATIKWGTWVERALARSMNRYLGNGSHFGQHAGRASALYLSAMLLLIIVPKGSQFGQQETGVKNEALKRRIWAGPKTVS